MKREAGVLLSVSSLPSREGIGTLGAGAYAFADFLSHAGFRVWQVLPLTPTKEGNSPYSSICATALNPLFIDLYALAERGLLREEEIACHPTDRVDYAAVRAQKERLLRLAFSRFSVEERSFVDFEKRGAYHEYAAFSALSEYFSNKPFTEWGEGFSSYDESKVADFLDAHRENYLYHLFTQYLFEEQWTALKRYANERGVLIFGDMPIYVAMNSAEVYFHPELFLFDERREPKEVAGVPPDYFNEEGQRWGNPLYDWESMAKDGYRWWRARILGELSRFDILRIDHFRGLDRYYAIKADAEDAKHGVWKQGPGAALFEGMMDLPIVAEDLGFVDESLRKMLDTVGFPGMKVYEFGLDGDPWSEHKPANYKENVVGYTGTHDNMPFRGYLDGLKSEEKVTAAKSILIQATVLGASIGESILDQLDASQEEREILSRLTAPLPEEEGEKKAEVQARIDAIERTKGEGFSMIDTALLTEIARETLLRSKARLAMMPMQDLLSLGEESRMNTPALVSEENWAWRLDPSRLSEQSAAVWKERLLQAQRT